MFYLFHLYIYVYIHFLKPEIIKIFIRLKQRWFRARSQRKRFLQKYSIVLGQLPLFAKCSGASYYPGCTSAPPPQQLCGQLSPPVPSPTLLISLKSCVIQPSGELETIHSDLSPSQPGWQLPEDMSAALCWEKSHILRFVFLKQLAQEQLETLARCVASGPPRASLPGCSVTHGDPSSPSKQNSTRLQESLCSNFRDLLSSAVTTS